MNKTLLAVLASAVLLGACHSGTPSLADRTDTLSWAMGENVAQTLMQGKVIDLNYDLFLEAVRHTLDGHPQPLSNEEYTQAMTYIMTQAQMQAAQQSSDRKSQVDQAQAQYFTQLASTNPNVKKHPSGFFYEVLKEGKGRHANYGDVVRFDYRSYLLLTGEVYDQTYGQREPITHVIGNPMFQGLVEGMQLMNAGSTYRFYFPYQLAFGEKGSGDIPGYTPFIYEIELHSIN